MDKDKENSFIYKRKDQKHIVLSERQKKIRDYQTKKEKKLEELEQFWEREHDLSNFDDDDF